MTEPSSPKYQFPGDIDRTQLRTEQQLDPMINRKMIMPNPLDPIGQIEAEGRAMRSISSGRMPTWVLMAAWGTIGLSAFLLLGAGLQSFAIALQSGVAVSGAGLLQAFAALVLMALPLSIPILIFVILCRATWQHRR